MPAPRKPIPESGTVRRYRHGRRTRSAAVIAAMDTVNRHRALTEAEVDVLYAAILQERQNRKRRPALRRESAASHNREDRRSIWRG
jgi:hypothetical protein